MDESTQKIKEYMDRLAPGVRSAVASAEWSKKIGEIAQKYSLHLDQITSLEYETLFVMIGMEPQTDFVANIQKEVGVSNILAGQLAEEINERVFKSILKTIEEKTEPTTNRFLKVEPLVQPAVKKIEEKPSEYVVGAQNEVITENPALAEIESIANSMPSGEKAAWAVPPEIQVVTEIKHEQKMVEPPVNLPGMEEDVTPTPQPVASTFVAPIPTPPAPSLADTKLSGITESQTEMKTVGPTKAYTVDPYREPIQ